MSIVLDEYVVVLLIEYMGMQSYNMEAENAHAIPSNKMMPCVVASTRQCG